MAHFSFKGRKENNKLFVPASSPFGTPIFDPKNPPEKVYAGVFFCILSQDMRHIKCFSWGPKWGVWVGAKKFMLKKFMCFFGPLSRAIPDLHRCNLGVALEQETFSRLPGLHPKRPLAPSPINF